MTKQIILIGGAPTTGKSTIADLLSKHLNLPWISTDQIRETMRTTTNRKDFPKLFNPEGYSAECFLTEFYAEQIVDMEMDQSEAVWPGVKKMIEDDYTYENGFIIEGVNILPHLVVKDFGDNENIKSIFLLDEDADRIKHVVYTRGVWNDAKTYSDDVKEKEVEWVSLFSHRIRQEVEKHGLRWIEVKKEENDLQAVLRALNL